MLAALAVPLPVDAALTAVALLHAALVPPIREVSGRPRTVLVSGGKMTKALALARAFHRAGHRVVLVESPHYRFTGHRFSRAVDAFHVVPRPQDPGYAGALLEIVRSEDVDVYVPVSSPVASLFDARAAHLLAPHCEVLTLEPAMVEQLDDKQRFAALADSLGLSVPDSHRVTSPRQVLDFDFAAHPGEYVLKSIDYDPVNRLDLTRLPRPTREETAAYVQRLPITPLTPWILQRFVQGREYCTHSTVREGRVQVYACSDSSPFQINYAMVERPAIRDWVHRFVGELGLSGQVSFDFIEGADGRVDAIECNPRTHSAITEFHDHPGLARAYLDAGAEPVEPLPGSRPTYWIHHELWRLLAEPGRRDRVRTIARGTDAIFDWADPLPFLAVHHLQMPLLLLDQLVHGRDWIRLDLNIGKVVQAAGD